MYKEIFYDSPYKAELVFKVGTYTLQLNWRNIFTIRDIRYKLCNTGLEEDLKHFLWKCETLIGIRTECGIGGVQMKELLFVF